MSESGVLTLYEHFIEVLQQVPSPGEPKPGKQMGSNRENVFINVILLKKI